MDMTSVQFLRSRGLITDLEAGLRVELETGESIDIVGLLDSFAVTLRAEWSEKQSVQLEILQGAYDTEKDHSAYLEAVNGELARQVAAIESERAILSAEQTGLRQLVSDLRMKVADLEAADIGSVDRFPQDGFMIRENPA